MTRKKAADTVIPFGKYQGDCVSEIASDEAGERYLEWLRDQPWFEDKEDLYEAVCAYLDREFDDA